MITPTGDFDISSLALPAKQSGPAAKQLGQDEFLELMITQIQNQDPFQPMESGAFLGQLAQFSTVTGISDISQSVASLSEALLANQALQASTIVGHAVLVDSAQGVLPEQGTLRGAVEMPDDAASVKVRITNGAGHLLRELEVDGVPGSLTNFEWDGVTNMGERAPAGTYKIEATVRSGFSNYQVPTLSEVRVSSVALDPGGAGSLITTSDGQQLRLSQVRAVM